MAEEGTFSLEHYAADAKSVVAGAQSLADELKHAEVTPLHLLVRALSRDGGVAEVVRRSGAEPLEVLSAAETALRRLPRANGGQSGLSPSLLELLARADREAKRSGVKEVQIEHLLIALSGEIRGPAGELLQSFGLVPGCFRPHLPALHTVSRELGGGLGGGSDGGLGGAKAVKPAPGAEALLAKYTRDLAAVAGQADPVIGRDGEVRRLLQILERRAKNHPLLVGEPGVGKTAVLRALARRIAEKEVPTNLAGARLLELSTGDLLAGAKLRGEIEDRLKVLLSALTKDRQRGETILVIDGIADLLGQGAVGSGVGDVLRPLLAQGDIRVAATTTPEGLRKMQERDSALLRRFSLVTVEPATIPQALEIVRGIASRYEAHHHVKIGEGAVAAAVKLASRYVQDRFLPDSAVDLLDETAARKRVEIEGVPASLDVALRRLESLEAQRSGLADDEDVESREQREKIDRVIAQLSPEVTELRRGLDSRRGARAAEDAIRKEHDALEAELVKTRKENPARAGEIEFVILPEVKRRLAAASAAVVSLKATGDDRLVREEDVATTLESWTGVPVQKMLEGEADKLLKMEERLRRRVVGQDEGVAALARAVRRGRVGLRDPGKPIGSFLFLGPSGVGKTELAKALAEFLFDDEQALTRLDMSEFMERHMAQRLLGAPPGYVDSEQGGFLTEAVRKKPYSVLLFDELEKAHADVFNLLLQVLYDGRLTDGRGRLADFSNTVVIMTSNIGSKRLLDTDPKMFESEEGREALRDVMFEELKAFFRPEFLNRVDDVLLFRPLRKEDLRGIVDIQLRKVSRLLEPRKLSLSLTDAAKTRLVDLSYEPAFGARPLRRTILKELQDPLAESILSANYPSGTTVYVDVANDAFTFRGGLAPMPLTYRGSPRQKPDCAHPGGCRRGRGEVRWRNEDPCGRGQQEARTLPGPRADGRGVGRRPRRERRGRGGAGRGHPVRPRVARLDAPRRGRPLRLPSDSIGGEPRAGAHADRAGGGTGADRRARRRGGRLPAEALRSGRAARALSGARSSGGRGGDSGARRAALPRSSGTARHPGRPEARAHPSRIRPRGPLGAPDGEGRLPHGNPPESVGNQL